MVYLNGRFWKNDEKMGTVPIYRGQDVRKMGVEEQRRRNQQSLNQLAERIIGGLYSALFPERCVS